MKNSLFVLATFIFGLFCEFFIRVVIIFYHQLEWNFSGFSGFPTLSWIVVFCFALFITSWIAAMLLVTVTESYPFKYLTALFALYVLWRINEYFSMPESSEIYILITLFIHTSAFLTAYFIKVKLYVQNTAY